MFLDNKESDEDEEEVTEFIPAIKKAVTPKGSITGLDGNRKKGEDSMKKQRLKDLSDLLKHPRNKHVSFDPSKRAFVYEEKGVKITLKGLNPALKLVFWPDYSYQESSYRGVKGTGAKSRMDGLTRGEQVHKQIEDYINLGTAGFMKKYTMMHTYTKKAIIAMREWRLKPCRAEFSLYDLRAKVGTRLDALLMDQNYEFSLVDWKCGFDDYILKGSGMLKGPLSGYSNSPLHQAYLQVVFEKIFLEKHYGFFVKNLYVIQINRVGIVPYPVPPAFLEISEEIYEYFCDTLQLDRDRKRVERERAYQKRKKKKKSTRSRARR